MSVVVDTSVWSLALRRRRPPDFSPAVTPEDYELAAESFNTCRSNGIQGSNTDFLICAVAHRRSYSILTTDKDFQSFQAHIPVLLLPRHEERRREILLCS
ncbi:MAG: hypothetical protein AB4426_24355 [Xenococcaceae cyanobacterium]